MHTPQRRRVFLSTPSARRATIAELTKALCKVFLSPPSARRATLGLGNWTRSNSFLSTPSARRATAEMVPQVPGQIISIHALREEGDVSRSDALT